MADNYFRKDYQLAKQWQITREEERINRLKRLKNRGMSKYGHDENRLEALRRDIQLADQEGQPRI